MAGPVTRRGNPDKRKARWMKREMKAREYRAVALAGGGLMERIRRSTGIVCQRLATAEMFK